MIQTTTLSSPLSLASSLPSNLNVRRVKTYTRKLAEIERFLETLGDAPTEQPDSKVVIHTYWK